MGRVGEEGSVNRLGCEEGAKVGLGWHRTSRGHTFAQHTSQQSPYNKAHTTKPIQQSHTTKPPNKATQQSHTTKPHNKATQQSHTTNL
jgi:hypothetical protein